MNPTGRRILGFLALTCCLTLGAGPARATEDAAGEADYILDEYVVDVNGGSDSLRLGAGLQLGNRLRGPWYGSLGGRVSWVQFRDGGEVNGLGLGAVVSVGHAPGRVVSPFASVALDKPFGGADRYDWMATITAGARVRVAETSWGHYAIRFALFHAEYLGSGSVPDSDDAGLAVIYSAAMFGRR